MTKVKIPRICSMENCLEPHEAKGYCNKHYLRWRKYGDANADHRPVRNRQCSVQACCSILRGAKGYCGKHYKRLKKYGDPLQNNPKIGYGDLPEDRFWSKVNKNGPIMSHMDTACWIWIGSLTSNGYGQFQVAKEHWSAHRYAWFLTIGTVPSLFLLHTCDNPKCVNPAHLREGTAQDNTQDMLDRNRCPKGEQRWNAVWDAQQVAYAIQEVLNGRKRQDVADELGIKKCTLDKVMNGSNWKHISAAITGNLSWSEMAVAK